MDSTPSRTSANDSTLQPPARNPKRRAQQNSGNSPKRPHSSPQSKPAKAAAASAPKKPANKGGRKKEPVDLSQHQYNIDAFFREPNAEKQILEEVMLDLAKVEKIRRYHCNGTTKGNQCTVKFDDPDAAANHCAEEHKAENRRGITFTDKIKEISPENILEASRRTFGVPEACLPFMPKVWKQTNKQLYSDRADDIQAIRNRQQMVRTNPPNPAVGRYNCGWFQGETKVKYIMVKFHKEFPRVTGGHRFVCKLCDKYNNCSTCKKMVVDHCKRVHKGKIAYDDLLPDWDEEDVMQTSEYMFGDRHWVLEKMPPAWRDNHKELIRSVSAEQRRVAALGTKTKASTKPCPVPIPQDVEEDDDEMEKAEAPNVDKEGKIRCHTCSSPVYKTPTCILDHFFGHYEKLYGVRRYICNDCGFETNSSTIPRRCRGRPNHTRIDHLTEFTADCIFTTSSAVFGDPYAVLQWLPEDWKEDLIARIRGLPPKTAMKKALMANPPDTDENCELALDERMCERVLRRLQNFKDQIQKAEEIRKRLKKDGKHKVTSCAVYLLVRADRIPEDRRNTTIEQLLESIYYVGVTENGETRYWSHFDDAKSTLLRTSSRRQPNTRKLEYMAKLAKLEVDTWIVKIELGEKKSVAEVGEYCVLDLLRPTGRLVNMMGGLTKHLPDYLKKNDFDLFGALIIYEGLQIMRTKVLERVKSDFMRIKRMPRKKALVVEGLPVDSENEDDSST